MVAVLNDRVLEYLIFYNKETKIKIGKTLNDEETKAGLR